MASLTRRIREILRLIDTRATSRPTSSDAAGEGRVPWRSGARGGYGGMKGNSRPGCAAAIEPGVRPKRQAGKAPPTPSPRIWSEAAPALVRELFDVGVAEAAGSLPRY